MQCHMHVWQRDTYRRTGRGPTGVFRYHLRRIGYHNEFTQVFAEGRPWTEVQA